MSESANNALKVGDTVTINPRAAARMRVEPAGTVASEVFEVSGHQFVRVRTRDCAGMCRPRTVGVNLRNVSKL
jgi:hypothetical protein